MTAHKGRPQPQSHPWRRSDLEGKYGVVPKPERTYNGVIYHSKAESDYAKQLDLLMHAQGPGRVVSWTRQVRVPLVVNGVHICFSVIDFLVNTADGKRTFFEVKGCWTDEARLKKKLFEALHPEKTLIVVKR